MEVVQENILKWYQSIKMTFRQNGINEKNTCDNSDDEFDNSVSINILAYVLYNTM